MSRPAVEHKPAPPSRERELYSCDDSLVFDSGYLSVGDGHEVYYEQCGNPAGKPAVFLHGGPGAGCGAKPRGFFDPAAYRVVLFDQRGAGKSRPAVADTLDGLRANTTWKLVADMELLRATLGIEAWLVFGGSWGSTLALAYAQAHPARVTELVLRGIFTLRRKELLWFYQDGASMIFPDAWAPYLAAIPADERGDLMAAYHRRLMSDDPAVYQPASVAWSVWEGSTSKLHPDAAFAASYGGDKFSVAFARIENHYFVNGGFMEVDDQLLRDAHKVAHIPTVIVQGRYDLVCPMDTAWELKQRLPRAEWRLIPDAGHSAWEPGTQAALLDATDKFRPAAAAAAQ